MQCRHVVEQPKGYKFQPQLLKDQRRLSHSSAAPLFVSVLVRPLEQTFSAGFSVSRRPPFWKFCVSADHYVIYRKKCRRRPTTERRHKANRLFKFIDVIQNDLIGQSPNNYADISSLKRTWEWNKRIFAESRFQSYSTLVIVRFSGFCTITFWGQVPGTVNSGTLSKNQGISSKK